MCLSVSVCLCACIPSASFFTCLWVSCIALAHKVTTWLTTRCSVQIGETGLQWLTAEAGGSSVCLCDTLFMDSPISDTLSLSYCCQAKELTPCLRWTHRVQGLPWSVPFKSGQRCGYYWIFTWSHEGQGRSFLFLGWQPSGILCLKEELTSVGRGKGISGDKINIGKWCKQIIHHVTRLM